MFPRIRRDLTGPNPSKQAYANAGMFRLTATSSSGKVLDFLAFCLEPLETLTLPKVHTVGTSLSTPVLDRLGALMGGLAGLRLVRRRRKAA